MIYILDTADINAIKHCSEFYPLAGVTTNPSIISREKTDFWKLVSEIRNVIGSEKMLHVQTVQKDAEKIVEEAKLLKKELGDETYIKIPVCEEGLKACRILKELNIKTTVTAIFTPTQALIAAAAGASFVAPYVNRIDNIAGDGCGIVGDIARQLETYGYNCRVLAASFKNVEQVNRCASAGCHSVTVSPEIMKLMISHPLTDAALLGFEKDWKTVYGEKTNLEF